MKLYHELLTPKIICKYCICSYIYAACTCVIGINILLLVQSTHPLSTNTKEQLGYTFNQQDIAMITSYT